MQTKFLSTIQRRGHQNNWRFPSLLLGLLLMIASGGTIVYGQTQDPPPLTLKINGSMIPYATNKATINVAPALTLTGGTLAEKINSAKVFLSGENFNSKEDKLSLNGQDTGTAGLITWTYDVTNGVLTLSGEATVADYQAALRKVTYTYTDVDTFKPKNRTIEIAIGNSLQNPENGHFYEFVEGKLTWEAAKKAAEAKIYEGRKGYLATVMSKDEDAFIASKLKGQGWMGATDDPKYTPEADSGPDKKWYWVTGPETGKWFFTQKSDANGCGNGAAANQPKDQYTNWSSGEPNDYATSTSTSASGCKDHENFAHFLGNGQWNDYPVDNSLVTGYVVEYGGMEANEPKGSLLTGQVTINYLPCSSCGDVHILTPDGLRYDFQATGDFLAVQSSDGKVIVQARQETSPVNPNVSLNTAVALSVGGDKIEFYVKSFPAYYLNGTGKPLPTSTETLPNKGTIQSIGNATQPQFIITWPDGSFAAWVAMYPNSHIDYGVAAGPNSQTYKGLLGNFDGDAQNDLQVKDGNLITPPPSVEDLNRFGNSWRVGTGQGESLFSVPWVAAQKTTEHTLVNLTEAQRLTAEKICKDGISDPLALRNCIYDVGLTNDKIFVASAKLVEESLEALSPTACFDAVQGKIAWHYNGDKRWNDGNIQVLCKGAESSLEPANCFQRVMHGGGVKLQDGTRDPWEIARDLCESTLDAASTIQCFESAIKKGTLLKEAIANCDK